MVAKIVGAFVVVGTMVFSIFPAFAETPAGGAPGDAIALTGTQSGTLDSLTEVWYQFYVEGDNEPLGVTLRYSPTDYDLGPNGDPMAGFEIWVNQCPGGACSFDKIGLGTTGELSAGVRHWRGSSSAGQTYFVKVFNSTPSQVSYAVAFTGDTFPPPWLVIAPFTTPGPALSTEPAPTPSPAQAPAPAPSPAAAPAQAPSPVPSPIAGGTTPGSAPNINGVMRGTIGGEHLWYKLYFDGIDYTGVVMNFEPASVEDQERDNVVRFRVWTDICEEIWPYNCVFTDVGGGTRSGLPVGQKYWRTGGSARTYFVELINESGQPIRFALALSGNAFPPQWLSVQ
ncbi:MAG: hypothetical protein HY675_10050 [Chloroflexi bacterium]|nr:hypothetical protein [Chloroflexota bacterium]